MEKIPTPASITFNYEKKEWAKQLKTARRELKIEIEKGIQKLAESLKEEKIPVTVKVIEGYPDEEIARIANSDDYDIIVMAKRRKLPGFKAILKLGSISRKVLEHISCPILLIDGEK